MKISYDEFRPKPEIVRFSKCIPGRIYTLFSADHSSDNILRMCVQLSGIGQDSLYMINLETGRQCNVVSTDTEHVARFGCTYIEVKNAIVVHREAS